MRLRTVTLLLSIGWLSWSIKLNAQTVNPYVGYERPYGPYLETEIDSVNVITGNLSIRIPLVSYPQRGGDLRLTFRLGYNHRGWNSTYECFINTCKYIWFNNVDRSVFLFDDQQFSVSRQQLFCPGPSCTRGNSIFMYIAKSADETEHGMVDLGNGVARATDASGIYASWVQPPGTSTIIDRLGIRHYYTGTISSSWQVKREDRNGNQILQSTSGYIDTLGRVISGAPGPIDYTGCTGPLPTSSAYVMNYPGPNGGVTPIKFCYANVQLLTNFKLGCGLSCNVQYSGSRAMLQSVVLPNDTAWTFEYNSRDPGDPLNVNYGDLTRVTLPTGGTISYAWRGIAACQNITYQRRAVVSRTVDANDGTGPHTWTYGFTVGSGGETTDPLGNDTVYTKFGPTCAGYVASTKYYQGSKTTGTLLKTVTTTYSSANDPTAIYQSAPALVNVVPIKITTTWANGKTLEVQRDYNDPGFNDLYAAHYIYGNLTAEREYDYGAGTPGPLLRQTLVSYLAFTNSNYLSKNLLDLVSSRTVKDATGIQRAATMFAYDGSQLVASGISTQHNPNPPNGSFRGNQTAVSRWLNGSVTPTTNCPVSVSNGYLVTNFVYFDTGTVNTSTDPCGHATSYAYSSTYAGAYPTTVTNALSQSTSLAYEFNTGQLTSATDANGQVTSYTYDSMWRVASASYPDAGQVTITHQESTFPFSATLTRKISSSQNLIATNLFDGLGRGTQGQLTSDPQGTVYTDTTYDANGRKATVSNPYWTKLESTYGVTTYQYDALNRTTKVIPPDGTPTNNYILTEYCGNVTKVTDQAGHWRRSTADGLGRLIEVDEPNSLTATVNACPGTGEPIAVTTYAYDVLGNATSIVQSASRQRSFAYDSLGRLTSSTNPETATVTYGYDADGNMITKTDARSITITYTYDALHRSTGTTYSNGDPPVTYTYDESACLGQLACYNVGRRTGMTDATGSEAWSYDRMGRELTDQRTTNSITKTTTYSYNLSGSPTLLTYPSGRVITYAYDNAARPLSAVDQANGVNYAFAATYAPQGALASLTLGATGAFAGINLNNSFNSRLQPNNIKAWSTTATALDLTYSFVDASSHNNGNVMGMTNNRDNTRSQTFAYDQLNRIVSAQTQSTSGPNCWGLTFGYDIWGNLLSANPSLPGCPVFALSLSVNANNRITNTGFSYDAAGNVTSDALNLYAWNGESQIKSAAGVNYTYDGLGRRVQKSNGKMYWYGTGAEILDETDLSGNVTSEYVYFGAQRIARRDGSANIYYYLQDTLGSSRAIVQSNGAVCYDADFLPYGGERALTNTCPQDYKFEAKERDNETGNDDFGARYYSSSLGRWLSPDWSAIPVPVPYANFTNPQTLNLYVFVTDNPETFADLDGHIGAGGSGCRAADGCLQGDGDAQTSGTFNPFAGCSPGMPVCGQAQTQSDKDKNSAEESTGKKAGEFAAGVWDTTGKPVVDTAVHPIDTLRNTKEQVDILINPGDHLFQLLDMAWAYKEWTTKIYSGDPRALGQYVGLIISLEITRRGALGREIKIGDDFRIAPTGNRTGHPQGKFPHYHRRGVGPNGEPLPGQSLKRHRPWETKQTDRSWRDRF